MEKAWSMSILGDKPTVFLFLEDKRETTTKSTIYYLVTKIVPEIVGIIFSRSCSYSVHELNKILYLLKYGMISTLATGNTSDILS